MIPIDEFSDIYSKDFQQNIYLQYEKLRKIGSVVFIQKSNCWIVLDYLNAKAVLEDSENYSSQQLKSVDSVLLGADGEIHGWNKKILMQNVSALHSGKAVGLHEYSAKLFDALIRQASLKTPCNFVTDVINPYTFFLALKAFGVHAIPQPLDIFSGTSNFSEKIKSINSLYDNWDLLVELIETNMTDAKLGNEIGRVLSEINVGEKYSHNEMIGFIKLLILAGTETTASLLASSVWKLLSDLKLCDLVSNDESLLNDFLREVLRVYSPAQFSFRTTTRDVLLSGISIPKSSTIAVSVGAVNRDPNVFDNPDLFDMNRKTRNLAFGSGSHRCVGEHLALYVAKTFLNTFLKLSNDIQFTGNYSNTNTLFTYKISNIETRFINPINPVH